MRLLLIGPPGSGKGTQGARIARLYGAEHIAAGDILRAEVASGSPLGRSVAGYLRAGELVPDDLIVGAVMSRVLRAALYNGYVLDGFPRSAAQAVTAQKLMGADDVGARRAVFLDVPEPVLIDRLLRRARIEGRSDDTAEAIARRLEVFRSCTAPVLDFYRQRGLLTTVDADADADTVTRRLVDALPALVRATRDASAAPPEPC